MHYSSPLRKAKAMAKAKAAEVLGISPPNFAEAEFVIEGTSPYVQNKFSYKAMEEMKATQEAGSQAKKGKKKEPKDFAKCLEQATHYSTDGWIGMPAPAFRNAMISACKLVGFHMTKAKLAVFVEADGFDRDDFSPLVKITKGKPQSIDQAGSILPVRLKTGVIDLRARPMFQPGWQAKLRVKFDQDQFSLQDVANLLSRVGEQVGIGEGRNDSKSSNGQGWGCFKIINEEEKKKR
jgi:hypothetical protein